MSEPIIKSGKFSAGSDLQCGENVVVDVAGEEPRVVEVYLHKIEGDPVAAEKQ